MFTQLSIRFIKPRIDASLDYSVAPCYWGTETIAYYSAAIVMIVSQHVKHPRHIFLSNQHSYRPRMRCKNVKYSLTSNRIRCG